VLFFSNYVEGTYSIPVQTRAEDFQTRVRRSSPTFYCLRFGIKKEELRLSKEEFIELMVGKFEALKIEWLRVSKKRKYLIPDELVVGLIERLKVAYRRLASGPPPEYFLNSHLMRTAQYPPPFFKTDSGARIDEDEHIEETLEI
jgi:hypothetical protein